MKFIFLLLSAAACVRACYWNDQCSYRLQATKTPYDAIRGDIRDFNVPQDCEAVSLWTLNRHGNKNPGDSVTEEIKYIASLKDEIVASHEAGKGQLCAQDVDHLRKWVWNSTLEVAQNFLTGTGYEELFGIATRIREKYPHLLEGGAEEYYFRSTNEQRTFTSAVAFVHGLSDGTNLTLSIGDVRERDDVIRPYENCNRYQQEVRTSQFQDDQIDEFLQGVEFLSVQAAVQQRLGITTQLTQANIYGLYELCRYDRSWSANYQSPWCAAFTSYDLVVLEYREDLRHYYMNGYGSWINVKLGGQALKTLYGSFQAAVQGHGKTVTSFFAHTNTMETVWCALGIYKDPCPLQGSFRNSSRLYMTSKILPFAQNMIAILNECQISGAQVHRVQIFINEKETELCPLQGCTWQQFLDKFQPFENANLDFCSMDYIVSQSDLGLIKKCS